MISFPPKPVPRRDFKLVGKSWLSLTAAVAFVPVRRMGDYGKHTPLLYVKTHPCVLFKKCPSCGAVAGQLCSTRHATRSVSAHGVRKSAWRRDKRRRR